ncbi:hypothetical protein KEJ18_05740 [Candidatus Bathyarchaeota archaeon]|nr:hypothetical protein [Candidatus Bathyarchaeota archaeon]
MEAFGGYVLSLIDFNGYRPNLQGHGVYGLCRMTAKRLSPVSKRVARRPLKCTWRQKDFAENMFKANAIHPPFKERWSIC